MKHMHKLAKAAAGCLFVLGWAAAGWAQDVRVGDPVQKVRAVLGEPKGYIGSKSYELYIYDRGRIEVKGGEVVSVDLVSQEEALAQRVEREQRQAEEAKLRRERMARRQAEGEKVKAEKIADPLFLALPAADQVAFWEVFREQYPGVDLPVAYVEALARYRREQEAAATQQRLAQLEAQVAEAQSCALAAENAAREVVQIRPSVTYWSSPLWCPYYVPLMTFGTRRDCGASGPGRVRPHGPPVPSDPRSGVPRLLASDMGWSAQGGIARQGQLYNRLLGSFAVSADRVAP